MDQASVLKISPAWIRLQSVAGRAVVYVPIAIAAWWFLLKVPSLWLLRVFAWLPLAFLIAPANLAPIHVDPDTHDWVFNVAVNRVVANPQTGESQRIDSISFAATEDDLAFFACGWFSYLAIAFSATGRFSRSQLKIVLRGLGLQTAINIFSLTAYAYINGYGAVVNAPNSGASSVWLYKYAYHLIYLVVPFVGPFIVGLLVHPEWRAYFAAPNNNRANAR